MFNLIFKFRIFLLNNAVKFEDSFFYQYDLMFDNCLYISYMDCCRTWWGYFIIYPGFLSGFNLSFYVFYTLVFKIFFTKVFEKFDFFIQIQYLRKVFLTWLHVRKCNFPRNSRKDFEIESHPFFLSIQWIFKHQSASQFFKTRCA